MQVDIRHSSIVRWATLAAATALLAGCAATSIGISKRDLDVQTKTSTSVFVDPVAPAERTIYVEVRSGVSEFDRRAFSRFIRDEFAKNENGYKVVDDPNKARYLMLAYVLDLTKVSQGASQAALQQGYQGSGDAEAGAAVGAVVGANSNHGYGWGAWKGAAVGGVVAGGVSTVANAFVQDVTYMLVCDVSIRERAAPGVMVRKDTKIDAKVSDAGSSRQTVSEVSDRKEYRTRIVTTAEKANLTLPEAQDLMFSKTAYAMSGFF